MVDPDTQTQVDGLFATFEPKVAKLGRALRSKLQTRLPGLFEIVYFYANQNSLVFSYSPTDRGHEGLISLAIQPDATKLYFAKGPLLSSADPHHLLQGTGKVVRFVPLTSLSAFNSPNIETLIAATLNLSPFTPNANPSTILRTASQKPGPPRSPKTTSKTTSPRKPPIRPAAKPSPKKKRT